MLYIFTTSSFFLALTMIKKQRAVNELKFRLLPMTRKADDVVATAGNIFEV